MLEPQSTQILVALHASDTYIIKIRPSSILCGANVLQQPLLPRWIAITHWTGYLKIKKIKKDCQPHSSVTSADVLRSFPLICLPFTKYSKLFEDSATLDEPRCFCAKSEAEKSPLLIRPNMTFPCWTKHNSGFPCDVHPPMLWNKIAMMWYLPR